MEDKELKPDPRSGKDSSDGITANDSSKDIPVNVTTYEFLEKSPLDKMIAETTSDKITNDSVDETSDNNSLHVTPGIDSADSGVKYAFTSAIELPSTVTDRKEIFMPLDIKIDDPRIYGKWMLFTNGDLNLQDHMWIKLQTLLLSGDIILLASSTARKCPDRGRFQGVIKCYTCEDKEIIKRAGIAIQRIMKDDIILNYKTNQASKESLYRGYGDRFITKYMLTINGKLYEKDNLDRWKKITNSEAESSTHEENLTRNCVPCVYPPPHKRRQTLGSEVSPSQETTKKRYVYPSYTSLSNFSGLWSLFCNAVDTDESGMTELDRTWNGAKILCDEGVFSSTSCETYAFQPRPGENNLRRSVTCELKDYCDIDQVMQSGDKLRERTSYNLPIYLKICYFDDGGKMKYALKYLYTDDRDLYEYAEARWRLVKRE